MKRLIFLFAIIVFVSGCAHVVPQELRDRAEQGTSIPALFKDPDEYKGRLFILGGAIVSSLNTQDGTYLEVIEKPLDYRERPEYTDISRGRFLVLYEGYLDTAVFSPGREVTVAGEVIGTKVRPLGEINYSYLLLRSRGLYLLKGGSGIPIQFGIGVWHSF
ncbi:MAG: Slp family lipoprotein [Nitrospirae bacterium]|nr:Slp family lipoprotein [Nitrospirota bacterium]